VRAERETMSSKQKQKHPLIPPSEATRTTRPHHNDVLCGRGGTINDHPGNKQYRMMVDNKKRVYLSARFKREKRLIATGIVEQIRNLNPPGRFLMREGKNSSTWFDIGDVKAREKVSQALRENALAVRKEMEAEYAEKKKREAREEAIAAGKDPEEAVRLFMKNLDSGKKGSKKPLLPGKPIHAPAPRDRRQPEKVASAPAVPMPAPSTSMPSIPSVHFPLPAPRAPYPAGYFMPSVGYDQPQRINADAAAPQHAPAIIMPRPTDMNDMRSSMAPIPRKIGVRQSRDHSPPNDRHVQFQSTISNDIPSVIDSRDGAPRTADMTSSNTQDHNVHGHQHHTEPTSPSTSYAAMSFLSGDTSVKTSDSLSYYLRGIEDEISGDVGQEVELVAHAPMHEDSASRASGSQRSRHVRSRRDTPPRHGSTISIGSYGGGSSSSRRRRKRPGNRVPSNSGQVQIDFNMSAVRSEGATAASVDVAAPTCGAFMPMLSPIQKRSANQVGSQSQQQVTAPLSPNTLDLDKMSLCGTENNSQSGQPISGADLLNVFDEDNQISVGKSNLMDMMSIGSQPSTGSSFGPANNSLQDSMMSPTSQQMMMGLNPSSVFGEESVAKFAADMSFASGTMSKTSQHSSSSSNKTGSRGSNKSQRSVSPASIDKNDKTHPLNQHQAMTSSGPPFRWDGTPYE